MLHDGQDLAVSTDEALVIAGIDQFTEGFLGYGPQVLDILKAADADPQCALVQAYCAMLHLFLESREGLRQAGPHVVTALQHLENTGEREQLFVEAIDAWFHEDVAGAIQIHEYLAEHYPRDLVSVKLCQYHHFNLGNAPGMLRVASKALENNQANPHMHGMIAFGYEQCHLLEEAEAAARTAIKLHRGEAWAHHALAHVLETRGQVAEGIEFMESVSDTWEGLNSFMHTHNWWHLCLYYIATEQFERVLDIYDRHIWGVWKEYSQDQIGAVSLLARLETAGVAVGDRWQDVADYLVARVDDHIQPFLDLQYLYGLARAERPEAEALLESLRQHVEHAPGLTRTAWREVALPAAHALLAHAQGDFDAAIRGLTTTLPRLQEIGGSHAQRGLFQELLLDAYLRSERLAPAQQYLELEHQTRPGVPLTLRRLARVYEDLDLPARALAARRGHEELHGRFH